MDYEKRLAADLARMNIQHWKDDLLLDGLAVCSGNNFEGDVYEHLVVGEIYKVIKFCEDKWCKVRPVSDRAGEIAEKIHKERDIAPRGGYEMLGRTSFFRFFTRENKDH